MPIFFTYSESPFNSLIDEGLKCKNYPMGIEVMAVLKKLLANARIGSPRGDTTTNQSINQYHKHSNRLIILYKIFPMILLLNGLISVERSWFP